jgi:hypothetical protein
MFQDVETFAAIAAGVQSYAIALAVVIGGIWTAWVFWIQRRTAVGVDLQVTQFEVSEEMRPHILITVSITNQGARSTRLVWEQEPLFLSKMTVPLNGSPSFQFVSKTAIAFGLDSGKRGVERSTGLRPGDKKKYEVMMSVDSPGLYQAMFLARAEPEHIIKRKKAIGDIEWKALGHVFVK